MKSFLIILFGTLMINGSALAQDSITFISGRVMTGLVKEVDSLDVKFEYTKRKKAKEIFITKASIFAIKYGDGRTEIFYAPMNEEEYSVREMELFILGEQDALRSIKVPLIFIGGIVVGGASTFILGPFYGLAPPFIYAMAAGLINNKVKEGAASNPALLREDTYLTGFVTKIKTVKIQKAITGSIIGYLVGLASIAIISSQ